MTGTRAHGRRSLERSLRLLVHSNVFISIATTGVAVSTIILAGQSLEILPLFIVFAVTMFVYSFNRLADRAEDRRNVPDRATFIDRYGRTLLLVGTGLYAMATLVAVVEGVPRAEGLLAPLAVAVLYSVAGVKRIFLVKNLLVGLAWGLIPLGVGVYYDVLAATAIPVMFVFVTVMITIAAVVFDIKDIDGDRAEGIRTVPVVFGPRRTRRIAALTSGVVGLVLAGLIAWGVLPVRFLLLLVLVGYVICYCPFATEERTVLFYGFVVDGEHVLLALIFLGYEIVI